MSSHRSADPRFRSLLYREPHLYDLVFSDPDGSLVRLCRNAFHRYLPAPPSSALDIGCGTARHLEALAETVAECWGVDLLAENVAYAGAVRPRVRVSQGDMRTVRLGRTFDTVMSFGNALSYALSDVDVARTMATYAAHARAGALLIVDTLNARSYLDGDGFRERIDSEVDVPGFRATSTARHVLDRHARILERVRVWRIPGQPDVEDYAAYRLLYPEELEQGLEAAGFEMLALADNRAFRASDLRGAPTESSDPGGMRGRKLYALARRRP